MPSHLMSAATCHGTDVSASSCLQMVGGIMRTAGIRGMSGETLAATGPGIMSVGLETTTVGPGTMAER